MKTAYDKAVEAALKREGQKPPGKPPQRQQQPLSAEGIELERQFDTLLDMIAPDLPKPHGYRGSRQWHPVWEDRQYRADKAWPKERVMVECEGHGHETVDWKARKEGRRSTKGYDAGVEKYNFCAAKGWVVLRVTKFLLDTDPDIFFNLLREVLTDAE